MNDVSIAGGACRWWCRSLGAAPGPDEVIVDNRQSLVKGFQASLTQDLRELWFERLQVPEPLEDGFFALDGEDDPLGASVVGIRQSFYCAHQFEIVHQLPHGLPGDSQEFGEITDAGADFEIDVGKQRKVRCPWLHSRARGRQRGIAQSLSKREHLNSRWSVEARFAASNFFLVLATQIGKHA